MNLGLRQLTGADIAVCKVEILARSEGQEMLSFGIASERYTNFE